MKEAFFALLVPLVLAFTFSRGATSDQQKHVIEQSEMIALYEAGRPVVNREIPAEAFVAVLEQAYNDAKAENVIQNWNNGQGIPQKTSLKPFRIAKSIIVGPLDVRKLRLVPSDELRKEVGEHLDKKKPPDQKEMDVGFVPISIFVDDTTFQNEVHLEQTVFAGAARFTNVIFKSEVSFANSYFYYDASFTGCTFGTISFNAAYAQDIRFDTITFKRAAFFQEAKFADINITNASFEDRADFRDAEFTGYSWFSNSTFNKVADFHGAVAGATGFGHVTFVDDAIFGGATIGEKRELQFSNVGFLKDTFFSDINNTDIDINKKAPLAGTLRFATVNFRGRAFFNSTRLNKLSISTAAETTPIGYIGEKLLSHEFISPTSFEKRAVFVNLQCNTADFTESEFHDYADFGNAQFFDFVDFKRTSFQDEADFHGTGFPELNPPHKGIGFDEVRFEKPIDLTWGQIDGRVSTKTRETWSRLIEAFKRSNNLEGQNATMYNQKFIDGISAHGWRKFGNVLDWGFWGYGVRVWRLVFWILLIYGIFTISYLVLPSAVTSDRADWFGWPKRFRFALIFSWLTSWKVGYGFANARTPLYKAITAVQSLTFKVLAVCLLTVFSHISPLLNDLAGKLLPH